MMKNPILSLLLVIFLIWQIAVATELESRRKLQVSVSILPQAYFVEKIGKENVEVFTLIGPGQSPHTFDPTPKMIAKIMQSDVYFYIGAPFESAILHKLKGSMGKMNIVDTGKGVEFLPTEFVEGEDHNHILIPVAPDPHIWLDPQRVMIIARNICEELIRIDSKNADQYKANLLNFLRELGEIDRKIEEMLKPFQGEEILVYHPAFGYFAKRYNLKQIAIEKFGKSPGAKELVELVQLAKSKGIRIIFVQPQFSKKQAEALASAIGGVVVAIDPLDKNYLENMLKMATLIRNSLQKREQSIQK